MPYEKLVEYLRKALEEGYKVDDLRAHIIRSGYTPEDFEEAVQAVAPKIDVLEEHAPVRSAPSATGAPGFFGTIKLSFFHPKQMMDEVRDVGIKDTVMYQMKLMIIPFVLMLILLVLVYAVLATFLMTILNQVPGMAGMGAATIGLLIFLIIAMALLYFIFVPVLTLVSAGLLYFLLNFLKGQGTFGQTFNALVYASTPAIILSIVPVINSIAGFYSIILQFIALSRYHGVNYFIVFVAWFILFSTSLLLLIPLFFLGYSPLFFFGSG